MRENYETYLNSGGSDDAYYQPKLFVIRAHGRNFSREQILNTLAEKHGKEEAKKYVSDFEYYRGEYADGGELSQFDKLGIERRKEQAKAKIKTLESAIKHSESRNQNEALKKQLDREKEIVKNLSKYADGGEIIKLNIAYLNKDKNHQEDRKHFTGKDWNKVYGQAVKWGKKNLDNFHDDMINVEHADGGKISLEVNSRNSYPLENEKELNLLLSGQTVSTWRADTYTGDLIDVFGNDVSILDGDEIVKYLQVWSSDNSSIYRIKRQDLQQTRYFYIPSNYRGKDQYKAIEKTTGYAKGGLTPEKAQLMLDEGIANGNPLTEKQKKYFHSVASGKKSKYAKGGKISQEDKDRIGQLETISWNYGELTDDEQNEYDALKKKYASGGSTRHSSERKSPTDSATWHSVGTQKVGNDGNTWIVKANKNGVQQWRKVKGGAKSIPSEPKPKPETDFSSQIEKLAQYTGGSIYYSAIRGTFGNMFPDEDEITDKQLNEIANALINDGIEVKDMPGFDYQGTWITDPTLDETGSVEVNPSEYYGEAYEKYLQGVSKKAKVPMWKRRTEYGWKGAKGGSTVRLPKWIELTKFQFGNVIKINDSDWSHQDTQNLVDFFGNKFKKYYFMVEGDIRSKTTKPMFSSNPAEGMEKAVEWLHTNHKTKVKYRGKYAYAYGGRVIGSTDNGNWWYQDDDGQMYARPLNEGEYPEDAPPEFDNSGDEWAIVYEENRVNYPEQEEKTQIFEAIDDYIRDNYGGLEMLKENVNDMESDIESVIAKNIEGNSDVDWGRPFDKRESQELAKLYLKWVKESTDASHEERKAEKVPMWKRRTEYGWKASEGGAIEWNLWGEKRDSEGRGTDNWEIINEKPLLFDEIDKLRKDYQQSRYVTEVDYFDVRPFPVHSTPDDYADGGEIEKFAVIDIRYLPNQKRSLNRAISRETFEKVLEFIKNNKPTDDGYLITFSSGSVGQYAVSKNTGDKIKDYLYSTYADGGLIKKGDYIKDIRGELGLVNKVSKGWAYVKFPSTSATAFQSVFIGEMQKTNDFHKGRPVFTEQYADGGDLPHIPQLDAEEEAEYQRKEKEADEKLGKEEKELTKNLFPNLSDKEIDKLIKDIEPDTIHKSYAKGGESIPESEQSEITLIELGRIRKLAKHINEGLGWIDRDSIADSYTNMFPDITDLSPEEIDKIERYLMGYNVEIRDIEKEKKPNDKTIKEWADIIDDFYHDVYEDYNGSGQYGSRIGIGLQEVDVFTIKEDLVNGAFSEHFKDDEKKAERIAKAIKKHWNDDATPMWKRRTQYGWKYADGGAVSLYFQQGSSDKEYHIQLKKENDGYVVNFQYGRRGNALKSGTKTATPVSLSEAQKIYDILLNSKVAKGYSIEASTQEQFSDNPVAPKTVHKLPQLLNMVFTAKEFINDDSYLAQEKRDGQRRMVVATPKGTMGLNKKGQEVPLPNKIIDSIEDMCTIDGEIIGDTLFAFDILALNGQNLEGEPCIERISTLNALRFGGGVKVVETAYNTEEKQELFDRLEREHREGIVFKKKDAPYTQGRPNSAGNQLKYKFYKTATFIVANLTPGKRSVGLELLDNGNRRFMGKVTIPPNKDVPNVGDFVEVRYLYAYKDGAIFQPTYLSKRTDSDLTDATIEQIIYKSDKMGKGGGVEITPLPTRNLTDKEMKEVEEEVKELRKKMSQNPKLPYADGGTTKMSMSYKLNSKDKRDVEFMWFKQVKDKRKSSGEIKDEISKKLGINYFEVSAYIDRDILDDYADGGEIRDEISQSEFGLDYNQLGEGEKQWVRDEIENDEYADGGAVAHSRKIVHSISKEDLKDAISDAHGEGELSETLTIDNLDKWSDDDFHIVSEYVIENRYDAPVYETFDERDDVSDAFSNYPDKPRPQYADGGKIKTSKDENGNWGGTYLGVPFSLFNLTYGESRAKMWDWSFKIYSPIMLRVEIFTRYDFAHDLHKTKKNALLSLKEAIEEKKKEFDDFNERRGSYAKGGQTKKQSNFMIGALSILTGVLIGRNIKL